MQLSEAHLFSIFLKQRWPVPDDDKLALDFLGCVPEILSPDEALYIANEYFCAPYFQAADEWDYDQFPLIRYGSLSHKRLTGTIHDSMDVQERLDIKQALFEFKTSSTNLKKVFKREASLDDI